MTFVASAIFALNPDQRISEAENRFCTSTGILVNADIGFLSSVSGTSVSAGNFRSPRHTTDERPARTPVFAFSEQCSNRRRSELVRYPKHVYPTHRLLMQTDGSEWDLITERPRHRHSPPSPPLVGAVQPCSDSSPDPFLKQTKLWKMIGDHVSCNEFCGTACV